MASLEGCGRETAAPCASRMGSGAEPRRGPGQSPAKKIFAVSRCTKGNFLQWSAQVAQVAIEVISHGCSPSLESEFLSEGGLPAFEKRCGGIIFARPTHQLPITLSKEISGLVKSHFRRAITLSKGNHGADPEDWIGDRERRVQDGPTPILAVLLSDPRTQSGDQGGSHPHFGRKSVQPRQPTPYDCGIFAAVLLVTPPEPVMHQWPSCHIAT